MTNQTYTCKCGRQTNDVYWNDPASFHKRLTEPICSVCYERVAFLIQQMGLSHLEIDRRRKPNYINKARSDYHGARSLGHNHDY